MPVVENKPCRTCVGGSYVQWLGTELWRCGKCGSFENLRKAMLFMASLKWKHCDVEPSA